MIFLPLMFVSKAEKVEAEIEASPLSSDAKERYLCSFLDRIKAVSM